MSKEDELKVIVESIFAKNNFTIEESRREQLNDFIVLTINGDSPSAHLTVSASLGAEKEGMITYILTDKQLIKIDIDEKEVQSLSYPLNTIIGIDGKLVDNRIHFSISFQNGSFGLKYPHSNKEVTDFFQKISTPRG